MDPVMKLTEVRVPIFVPGVARRTGLSARPGERNGVEELAERGKTPRT